MRRLFIFRCVRTGEELVLPVTPSGYELEAGRKVEPLDMQETGTLNLPGLKTLLDKGIECMFPAQAYPFVNAGAQIDPWYYVDKIRGFSEAAEVLRFVVSDTSVNEPVMVESITYGERDGTGDVYATIRLKGYRAVSAPEMERTASSDASKNAPRAAAEAQEAPQQTYVVVKGDSLWSICRKYYGDGSLAYRLAAYNNIANANLLYVGQVLTLPALAEVQQTPPAAAPSVSTGKTSTPAETPDATPDDPTPAPVETVGITVSVSGAKYGEVKVTAYDDAGKMLQSRTYSTTGSLAVPKGSRCRFTWCGDRGTTVKKAVYTYNGSTRDVTGQSELYVIVNKGLYFAVVWQAQAEGGQS